MKILVLLSLLLSCSSYQAKRVDEKESDEKALEITDRWNQGDTERIIKKIVDKIKIHSVYDLSTSPSQKIYKSFRPLIVQELIKQTHFSYFLFFSGNGGHNPNYTYTKLRYF